jgi:hypothetical protein
VVVDGTDLFPPALGILARYGKSMDGNCSC